MVPFARMLCCLALVAIGYVVAKADPPGDLSIKQISFVATADASLAKPVADSQAAMLSAVIREHYRGADARVSQDGRTLFVAVANPSPLLGAEVKHFSDCAINSQFQFQENPKFVKAPPSPEQQDDEFGYDWESALATNRRYAQMPVVKRLLTTWTMSRHAAPAGIAAKYSVYGNVDVTLDAKQLTAHREAVKSSRLIAGN